MDPSQNTSSTLVVVRGYAKGIVEGDSDRPLPPEEQQALAAARTGKGGS